MNEVLERRVLWVYLVSKIVGSKDRWIVYGDFNVVLDCEERISKFWFNIRYIEEFVDCGVSVGLVDL